MRFYQMAMDLNGQISCTRVAMLFVIFVTMIGWVFVLVTSGTIPDLPAGLVSLIVALITGKTIQKQVEKEPKK